MCSTSRAFFITGFFLFFVLVVSLSQKTNRLSFQTLVFCSFVFRLESSLQKNNLSSSELVLIQFGYRGFLFLVMLLGCGMWCLVSLRWLVWFIMKHLSNRVKEKLKCVKTG